jgi:hypothetical protein
MFYISKHSQNKHKQISKPLLIENWLSIMREVTSVTILPSSDSLYWKNMVWGYIRLQIDTEELHNLYILLQWLSQQIGHAAYKGENEKYIHKFNVSHILCNWLTIKHLF